VQSVPEENFALTRAVFRTFLQSHLELTTFCRAQTLPFRHIGVAEMVKVERILCPTDLSTESDEALRYAIALARVYEAKLFLLHCNEENSRAEEDDETSKTQMNRLFAESLVPHLGLANLDELDWHGLVRSNVHDVGNAIVREAVAQKIDLIVMRSRRRPRAAVLLG